MQDKRGENRLTYFLDGIPQAKATFPCIFPAKLAWKVHHVFAKSELEMCWKNVAYHLDYRRVECCWLQFCCKPKLPRHMSPKLQIYEHGKQEEKSVFLMWNSFFSLTSSFFRHFKLYKPRVCWASSLALTLPGKIQLNVNHIPHLQNLWSVTASHDNWILLISPRF